MRPTKLSQKNYKQYFNCDLCFFIRNRLENLEIATKQRKTKQNQSEPPAEPNTHNGAKKYLFCVAGFG